MAYYHGSGEFIAPGTVLRGRGEDYEKQWSETDFYAILERYRPHDCLAHKDAVFMVKDPDDIDAAGGMTDWCCEVVPSGRISRHDINWSTEISILISDGKSADSEDVSAAAKAYWEGTIHVDGPFWEYLTEEVSIKRCEPFETFEVEHVRGFRP